nr:pesticidal crystal protein Orf3Aa [Bacillus thuringiensis]
MKNVPNKYLLGDKINVFTLGRYELIISLTFVNPGEWGKPEPFGSVSMIYDDQIYTVWSSTADKELESYTKTLRIYSETRPAKVTFVGDVGEYDSGNGNDILVYPDRPVVASPNQSYQLLGEKDSDGQSYVGVFYTVREITPSNLLVNGDFEYGLGDWVQSNPQSNNPTVKNILGNNVLEANSGASASNTVSNLVKNADYFILYDTELIGDASARVEVRDKGSNTLLISSDPDQSGSYMMNFTTKSNTVKIILKHNGGTGIARFDNISVFENSKSNRVNTKPLPISSLLNRD